MQASKSCRKYCADDFEEKVKRKRDEDTGKFCLSCASSLQYLDMRLPKYREMSYVQLKDHL